MTTSELIIFLFSCTVISMLRFLLSSREGGGGWGYSLQWPIQGGSAQKSYLLHGFKYMKGRAFTT